MMERSTLRIHEAAKLLGIGRSSAYQAVKRGELPTIRIGRLLLVPRSAIETMLHKANETPYPGPRDNDT